MLFSSILVGMYNQITANKRKTVLIMVIFVVFVGALSFLVSLRFGTPRITYFVLVGALLYAAMSYMAGSRLALAVSGAKEIQKRDNPRLYRVVENLAITDGLITPKIYIMADPSPNAFATGRDPLHASVAVTSGLLEIMDDQELEGVIAHELGHVKNYDIRVSMIAFALVAAIGLLADVLLRLAWFGGGDDDRNESNQVFMIIGIVAAVVAPVIATLIQLAVSRSREYLADATGALTTRYPEGLASALEKIQQTGSSMQHQNTSTAHLFFANPLKSGGVNNLFSTHPPIDERIRRLRGMIK